jgi:hypothetical protein
MGHIRIEDGFPENAKVRKVGPNGIALYVSGLCYCSRQLSDGIIPDAAVPIIAEMVGVRTHRSVSQALTKARLWKRVRGGYQVPDYLKFNPSREEISRKREESRKRQQAWRDVQRNAVTNSVSHDPLVSDVVSGVEKSKSTDQLTDYPKIADKLGSDRYVAFQKLMRAIHGGDGGTPNVIAGLCKKLPASKINLVAESYSSRAAPVGKVVVALKQKVSEYEVEVKRDAAA